jgi:flagellar biosynthesis protein FliR
MTRKEWKAEKRHIWWIKHQALAGIIVGSCLLVAPALIVLSNKEAAAVLNEWLDGWFGTVAAVIATLIVLTLFVEIVIGVINKDERRKR